MKKYLELMRLHKPIGIFLLLWPTLWALWLASNGHPDTKNVIIFVIGVIIMRSAGCIINDFADRHIDKHVARTRERPLTTGAVSVRDALILFCILLLIAFSLVLFLNRLTIELAFVGAALAIIYPFLKRITHLPQVGLGLAFAWGVIMAFTAETNQLTWPAGYVFLIAAIWPVMYDTQYAIADREDDKKINVKSTAILFGKYTQSVIILLQIILISLLWHAATIFSLAQPYYLAVIITALLFIYQTWLTEKRQHGAFQAFMNNHWVGLIIFIGIILS